MPNPIAHPAASIPFNKVGMVFSALVIGSISPDFGYLFPLPTPYFMYNLAGLILFDVPVGFVLLFLFHSLVKWPLLSLFPKSLQSRLFKPAQGFSFTPLKHFGLIILSLLIGSLTHIIWDSFTHEYGWIVEHFAFFRTPINGTPLYSILQNLSSVIGFIVLLYLFIRWLQTAPKSNQLMARFSNAIQILFLLLTSVSFAVVEGLIIYLRISTGSRLISGHYFLGSTIFSGIFIISFFAGIYCLAWMITFHKTIRRSN